MALRTHPHPDVQAILTAFGGHVMFDMFWVPSEKVMREGLHQIRSTAIWASEQIGRAVPAQAQEVLRWLRDHWGPDEDRKKAQEKYALADGGTEMRVSPAPSSPSEAVLSVEALAMSLLDASAVVANDPTVGWLGASESRKANAVAIAREVIARRGGRLLALSESLTSPVSASSPASS